MQEFKSGSSFSSLGRLGPADRRWFVTQVLLNVKAEKNQAAGPSLVLVLSPSQSPEFESKPPALQQNPFTTSFPVRSSS